MVYSKIFKKNNICLLFEIWLAHYCKKKNLSYAENEIIKNKTCYKYIQIFHPNKKISFWYFETYNALALNSFRFYSFHIVLQFKY